MKADLIQEGVKEGRLGAGRKMGLWRVLAWLALACGLVTYFVGLISAITGTGIWSIPTGVWFYDAIAAGVFAVFFLIYAADSDRRKAR